jgi:hypothetical protein
VRKITTLALMLAAATAIHPLPAAPKSSQEVCRKDWTIGGPRGAEPLWLRTNGYRVGMSKMQAANVDRHRGKSWMIHDAWQFASSGVAILLEFEKGELTSCKMSLPAAGYEHGKIYADLVKLHGAPAEAVTGRSVWRHEECNTVKVLMAGGESVSIVIQSLERFERSRTPPKSE